MPATSRWGFYAGGQKPSSNDLSTTFKQIIAIANGSGTTATYRTNKVNDPINPVAIAGYDSAYAALGTDIAPGSGGAGMVGDIAEIVVTFDAMTATNIALLEAYGSARYGI